MEPIINYFKRLFEWVKTLLISIQKAKPSENKGMGAIAYLGGTTFRVWSPNAAKVAVVGSFNQWKQPGHPLASENNGYWSADILGVELGDEYKYLITPQNGKPPILRTDPYARKVTLSEQNSIIHRDEEIERHPFTPPDISKAVIYEMHVGTFNVLDGTPPGDFASVIEKLPYLQKLGINVIELMPIMEFEGQLSWGYNPGHPFAITEDYGGREGLRRLIEAAHRADIAVVIDVVYNHFGPQQLDLWQFDGWSHNGLGGIYFYNDDRAQTPWGHTRPDYGRPEVRQYIRDNAMMLFNEIGADGLRWDATSYIRTIHGWEGGGDISDGWGLMQWINQEADALSPRKLMIGEDLQENDWMTKSADAGGAGFDTQWSSKFVHTVRHALITPYDEERDMIAVSQAIGQSYNGDPFQRVIYTESHDEVANGKSRVPEEIDPGSADSIYAKKRATLGAAIVFTSPGIPMIFQGQEFLEDSWFRDDVPLDWGKLQENGGLTLLYRDLIRLRKNLRGVTGGLAGRNLNIHHINNADKLIAYHRWSWGGPGDDVIIVANFANVTHLEYTLGFPKAGVWKMRFNSDLAAYDPEFSNNLSGDIETGAGSADGMSHCAKINIAPYSVIIFSQEPA